jgi:hypothetical protein
VNTADQRLAGLRRALSALRSNQPRSKPRRRFYDNRHWYSPRHVIHDLFAPGCEGAYWDKLIRIWECCEGDGRLVEEMRKLGYDAVGSDLQQGHDFLTMSKKEIREIVGTDKFEVLTNPQFDTATDVVLRAFEVAYSRIAILLPFQYYTTVNRTKLFDKCPGDWRFSALYAYTSKPKFTRPDGTVKALCRKPGPSNLEIGWFVWKKGSHEFRIGRIRKQENWNE